MSGHLERTLKGRRPFFVDFVVSSVADGSAWTAPEDLPAPRVIGRTLGIVVGAVLLYRFVQLIAQAPRILAREEWNVPRGSWWVDAFICIFLAVQGSSTTVSVAAGYILTSGLWPAIRGGALGLLAYGSLWAPLILLLFFYVYGHAGFSFLIPGLAGTPG